jgi:streptogramin lyase
VTNNSSNGVSKFLQSTGAALSPSNGYTGGGLSGGSLSGNGGTEIAIDGSGNVWLTNITGASISEFSNAGAPLSPSTGYTASGVLENPTSVAVDGSGNVWITSAGTNSVVQVIGAATPVVTPLVANLVSPYSGPASKP